MHFHSKIFIKFHAFINAFFKKKEQNQKVKRIHAFKHVF